jgi:hypothetical protein
LFPVQLPDNFDLVNHLKIHLMKTRLIIIGMAFLCFLSACKKGGNETKTNGIAITDDSGAKALFSKMNGLWTGTLKPALAKTNQTYTNTVLNGASGTATVNGQYTKTFASSSFSSTSTSTVDVTIVFKDYEVDGMRINGTMRFFDYSNYRSACSSSGCVSSSHSSIAYRSVDGSGASLGSASVRFDYSGKTYTDAVLMSIGKSDNAHWSIVVTNSAGQTINTSY